MANASQPRRANTSGSRSRSGLRDATPVRGPRPQSTRGGPARALGLFLAACVTMAALAVIVWRVVQSPPQVVAPAVAQTPEPRLSPTARSTAISPTVVALADGREHRWLGRPLARTALRDFADRTYLFGSSKSNAYRVHHGLDMVNPTGTPVQAAADGLVVFAGKDSGTRFGPATLPNFYGNLVLVKLARQYRGQDVYYLNGHLDQVTVREGQQVKEGDQIGAIGMTGVADGPHLHFEVRVGGVTYANSRNAALWLRLLPGTGGLVGKITDRAGKAADGVTVTLMKDITASDVQKYWGEASTYVNDPLGKLNPDEDWGENVAFGDLPVGQYEVRANLGGQTYLRHVTIYDGKTTRLELQEGSALE